MTRSTALASYKSSRGLLNLDDAVTSLLDSTGVRAEVP